MKTAVITGAGSGVGRAVAVALAKEGWTVALVGRRSDVLEETARLCKGGKTLVHACDIGDIAAVTAMAERVQKECGPVEVLVNAAGTNVPKRSLEVLSNEDYHLMLNTNLNGAYYCVQAFLPAMRERKSGTIVNVISDAAKQASPKAGPGYAVSKFGMLGLTQAINAEERGNGVRASALLPGDIDTPLLDKRPSPPPAEARARMLKPDDVAACALLAINLPQHAIVEELLIRPR
ncbi:MAG TPA: SDR family oxidoreductase [Methylomirabilota bacterium]|nr:SDR family oxidoreductase [Methylomirabilota bacterium]